MRTRLLVGFGLLILVGIVSLWLVYRSLHNHRINSDGYAELKLGMTEQEVVSVLGVPAGDYGPGKGEILMYGILMSGPANTKTWLAGDFAIIVCFDQNGRVYDMGTDGVYRPYDTFFEMLCQKVGLKQKKPYPFVAQVPCD